MKQLVYLTILSMTAFTLNAAETELKAKAGDASLKVEADADVDRDAKARVDVDRDGAAVSADARVNDDTRAVVNANKASALLGMEVRNQNNEKLGEVKDLVLDLKTGKVNYAVLAAGGFLGLGEKLLAVPVGAFNISEDQNHLVLNADKAKVQAAVGFPATNWPHPNDQRISSYWLSTDGSAGAPAPAETDRDVKVRGKVDVDREKNPQLKVNVDDDNNEKLYTEPKDAKIKAQGNVDLDTEGERKGLKARADIDADTRNANWKMMEGEVLAVDPQRNIMTVKTKEGELRKVYLDNDSVLRLNREQVVRLNDYKPGYFLRIDYEMEDGKMTARRVVKTDGP